MNRGKLQKLDTHIRNRISELQAYMDEKSDSQANTPAAANPHAIPDRALEQKIAEMDRLELMRLQSNLRWLESESGGCCEQCGCDIPMERLLVVPATRLCVNCAR